MHFTEEVTIVDSVDGDFVFLETQNRASCNNCSSKSGCGSLSSVFTFKPRHKLRISNTLGLKEGDSVIVSVASDKLLIATILMYVLPLILMLTLSLLAKLFVSEAASIIAGLCGLFIGLFWVKRFTQQSKVAKQFQPKLVRKIINVEVV